MISSQPPIHVVTQDPQKRTKRKESKYHAVNFVYYIFLRTSFYNTFLSIQVHIYMLSYLCHFSMYFSCFKVLVNFGSIYFFFLSLLSKHSCNMWVPFCLLVKEAWWKGGGARNDQCLGSLSLPSSPVLVLGHDSQNNKNVWSKWATKMFCAPTLVTRWRQHWYEVPLQWSWHMTPYNWTCFSRILFPLLEFSWWGP